MSEPHACVDGEVIDSLLGLLNECVFKYLPIEFGGVALNFFKCLIDRHSAYRDRGIAQYPATNVVNVAPRGEVHDRISTPTYGPDEFFHLFGGTGGDGGVADIGIDFDEKIASDDDGLQFRVVNICGNDGAPNRDLCPHEFWGDICGDGGAKAHTIGQQRTRLGVGGAAAEVFAMGDKDHLLGNYASASEFILSDKLAGLSDADVMSGGTEGNELVFRRKSVVRGCYQPARGAVVLALRDPGRARARQTGFKVEDCTGLSIRAGGVV